MTSALYRGYKPMKRVLYMRTTVDELELPIAVAETPGDLAKMLGTTANSVSCSISHHHKGWHRIEYPDDKSWKSDE